MTRHTGIARCCVLPVLAMLLLWTCLARAAGEPPTAPGNLQGSITDGVVTLNWSPSSNDDGPVGYNIYVDGNYADTVFSTSYTGPVVEGTLTSFYVVAFDTIPRRFSPRSAELVLPEDLIPTDLTIPPTVPTNLRGEIVDGQVTLQWDASTDDEAVRGYNVYRDNNYLTTVFDTRFSTANPANETHVWSVVAFDIRNNFSPSSARLTLPATGPVDTTIPPSVPVILLAEATAGDAFDTVELVWQASTDDQAVRGYNVYLNQQYLDTVFVTRYQTQVPADSTSVFQIAAFDFDENFSALSEAVTVEPADAPVAVPPAAPTGLTVSSTTTEGRTSVSLTWIPSRPGNNPVRGYNVYRDNAYLTTVFNNGVVDTLPIGSPASYYVIAFDVMDNFSARSESVSILGSINQPPFFANLNDQVLRVNERWELVLSPTDVDGDPAGVLVTGLPEGVQFIGNPDQSRTLFWVPGPDDIGVYSVEATAFELRDPDIRTSQTFTITVTENTPVSPDPFSLQVVASALNLVEGDPQGIDIPVNIQRQPGYELPIRLDVEPVTAADAQRLFTRFSNETLAADTTSSTLSVGLEIDTLPILPEQRRLRITATSDDFQAQTTVTLAVTPVPRDDVYLLIGQSNMVGASGSGAKRSGPGEPDQPDIRIVQPNVTGNSNALLTQFPLQDNLFDRGIVRYLPAEDPLHLPVDPESDLKAGSTIGMGLTFAKTALPDTTRRIVLVPAAWSGSAFCNTQAPGAHWNPVPTDNPELGNTLLFDRALARVNNAIVQTGGVLRGILWHQGESDSTEACAPLYQENIIKLAQALRTRIVTDARGPDARGPSSDVPFVVGTMSRGVDENSDFSDYSESKLIVDNVHRNISSLVPFSEVTINDDLVPANGYPCGEGSCIHFGPAALREMGARTYGSLQRAAQRQ